MFYLDIKAPRLVFVKFNQTANTGTAMLSNEGGCDICGYMGDQWLDLPPVNQDMAKLFNTGYRNVAFYETFMNASSSFR